MCDWTSKPKPLGMQASSTTSPWGQSGKKPKIHSMNLAWDLPSGRRKAISRALPQIHPRNSNWGAFIRMWQKEKTESWRFLWMKCSFVFIYESRHQGLWPLLPIQPEYGQGMWRPFKLHNEGKSHGAIEEQRWVIEGKRKWCECVPKSYWTQQTGDEQ